MCVAVGLPMCRAAIGLPVHQGNGCLCIQKWEIPSLRRNKNKCTSLVMHCETIVSLQDNSNWRVAEVIYTSPSSLPPKLSCRGTPHKIDLHDGINNTLIKNNDISAMMHLDASSPFDHSINCCSIKNQLHLMCIPIVGWRRRGRGCMGRRGPGAAKSPPSTPPIILEPRNLVSIWVMQRAGYMVVQ